MDGVDALQARREAQAQARRAATQNLGIASLHNSLLYAAMVPQPGGVTVPQPGSVVDQQSYSHSRGSTPTSASDTTPRSSHAPAPATRTTLYNNSRPPADYSGQSGVFIPAGAVRVTPTTSPITTEIDAEPSSTSLPVHPTLDTPFVAPPIRRVGSTATSEDSGALSKMSPGQLATLTPRTLLLQGYVLRERGGFMSNPKYRFFLETKDTFVMASRRRGKKQSSNYVVSLDANDLERDSDYCFAKVRSNFTGTQFVFYTADRDDKKELGAVLFEVNPGGIRGPRKMTVIVPKLTSNGVMEEWACGSDDSQNLVDEYTHNPESNRITILENKAPQWNEAISGFQLNFGGRIGMPSVKNFQLVDRRDVNQNVVLQFGKWSADRFSLDFKSPLNATQAFCIALTSFDNKLLCE